MAGVPDYRTSAAHMPLAPRNVLIVDDDPDVRALLSWVVLDEGFLPLVAASGTEGYGLLQQFAESIAVVLLDLNLPGLTGAAFRRAQRRDRRLAAVPCVLVTGEELNDLTLAELQPSGYLAKPFELKRLVDHVNLAAWSRYITALRSSFSALSD